jgi:cobalt/nickel transport system permease protein
VNLRAPGPLGAADSPIHRLDARVKLLGLLAVLVIAVTTPPSRFMAFAGYLALLIGVSVAARIPPVRLARRVLPLLGFVAVVAVFIPFLHQPTDTAAIRIDAGFVTVSEPGVMLFWNALVKAGIGILCAALLGATTHFPDLLEGLERLRVPRVAVALTGFTYRYLFVLADEALRMLRARDARCYGGRWLWQSKVIGLMVGTLFVRAHDRAERVYGAMLARGFTGTLARREHRPLRVRDYAFLALAAVVATLLRTVVP